MFWPRFPLYEARPGELPDDPPPDDPPLVPPGPVRQPNQERRSHVAPKAIPCGFCECEITTMEGAVVKMSKRAKDLRVADELIESLRAKITDLEEKNAELRRRTEPAPVPANTTKGGWWE